MNISRDHILHLNRNHAKAHAQQWDRFADSHASVDLDAVQQALGAFEVAIPSWALRTGGTRFGRFPDAGEPRNVYEKLRDIALVHRLTTAAPRVSLHIPWDAPEDAGALRAFADHLGVGFDAVNSNTFQDQAGQPYSYKFGSLCHSDAAVRSQAVEHHRQVIALGAALGSRALTVWLADGSNYPGQMHLRKSFERTISSLQRVYTHLPDGWQLFTELKPFEPAFYATVVQDWGSSLLIAQALGPKASCLVDLGHHLPGTNVEQVVARLITAEKLGGFHFNDSKYGDDDLTAGSIHPYQLFLVFNELVDAAQALGPSFQPAYMIDQSHNVKDPIEALLTTVDALQSAYAKALMVDREALDHYQAACDAVMAEKTLKDAYETDVRPLVQNVRQRRGGALELISTFRASGYRQAVRKIRGRAAYTPPQSL